MEKQLSGSMRNILAATYILLSGCAATGCFLFITARYSHIWEGETEYFLFFAFVFSLASLACALASPSFWGRLFSLLYMGLLLFLSQILMAVGAYSRRMRGSIGQDDLYAVFQTHLSEAWGFFTESLYSPILALSMAGLALVLLLFFYCMFILSRSYGAKLRRFRLHLIGTVGFAGAACFVFIQAPLLSRAVDTWSLYRADLIRFNEVYGKLSSVRHGTAVKEQKGELYVLIIGESQNRDLMECYGGPTDNTPWMEGVKNTPGYLLFNNAYSAHTHTDQVLRMALFNGRTLTGGTYPEGHNVISTSRLAGMNTVWISNQMNMGEYDTVASAMAHTADYYEFASKKGGYENYKQKPDEVILPMIDKALKAVDFTENTLLVIHIMGNHAPYQYRYPPDYPYRSPTGKKFRGFYKHDDHFSSYDASIHYTDAFLSQVMGMIGQYSHHPVTVLYVPDHGEDPMRQLWHNVSDFTWTMARIPMMLWMSEAWQKRYPLKADTLRAHTDRVFTNDLLYDLYVGLASIEMDDYRPEYDLSGAAYSLHKDNARIITDRAVSDDPFLRAAENVKNQALPMAAAHRCNSIFKTRQARQAGIKSIELDLLFSGDSGKPRLMVGHDAQSLAGMDAHEYFANLPDGIEFIWLDIKNLTGENSAHVYGILNDLDKRYGLRARCLVESLYPRGLTAFAEKGWQTAYYLKWKELSDVAALDTADARTRLNDMLEGIKNDIRANNIGGVSYEFSADQLVRNRLKPLLGPATKYYAWDLSLKYTDKNLAEKAPRYAHVERVLIQFDSVFNL